MLDRAIETLWREPPDQCPGVVVIAHSLGAAVAVHLAARHPHWPLLGLALNGLIDSPPERFVNLFHEFPSGRPVNFTSEQRRAFMYGPADTIDPDIIEQASHPPSPVPSRKSSRSMTAGLSTHRARQRESRSRSIARSVDLTGCGR